MFAVKWLSISDNVSCSYMLEEVKQRLEQTESDAIAGVGIKEDEADLIIDKYFVISPS